MKKQLVKITKKHEQSLAQHKHVSKVFKNKKFASKCSGICLLYKLTIKLIIF
jgi:hypothetical protein